MPGLGRQLNKLDRVKYDFKSQAGSEVGTKWGHLNRREPINAFNLLQMGKWVDRWENKDHAPCDGDNN